MARSRSRRSALADILDNTRKDRDESIRALRLQAMAWRQLALIAMHDPEYARRRVRWLLACPDHRTDCTEEERAEARERNRRALEANYG